MDVVKDISRVISDWAHKTSVLGKTGKRRLQPTLAAALREAGFVADEKDGGQILRSGMPVWRSKDDRALESAGEPPCLDLMVYRGEILVGMIEAESDLNDLRLSGVTRREGHHDVWSIARSAAGSPFDSYKSLERMACAALYWDLLQKTGTYPSAEGAIKMLTAIRSDNCHDHNPAKLGLFLVSGLCRVQEKSILAPRLHSLGADLVCVFVV